MEKTFTEKKTPLSNNWNLILIILTSNIWLFFNKQENEITHTHTYTQFLKSHKTLLIWRHSWTPMMSALSVPTNQGMMTTEDCLLNSQFPYQVLSTRRLKKNSPIGSSILFQLYPSKQKNMARQWILWALSPFLRTHRSLMYQRSSQTWTPIID